MDRLCEITARMSQKQPVCEIPAPDYDFQDRNDGLINNYSVKMETVENTGYITPISPDQIRSVMSKGQKELQKDLKIMQRSGVDFQAKRPEFKAKHHEIKSKGMQREEDSKESELSAKLKSRSNVIKQAEEAQKIEDEKPEFMKINLRKGKGGPK